LSPNHSISSLLIRAAGAMLLALVFLAASALSQTITPATGGNAISADNTGGGYVTLTGPVYSEGASGNAGVGTIILNVPSGFVFDTGAPNPTVLITRIAGSGGNARNINGVASGTSVVASVTATQITFTVTSASNSSVRNSLTWQNIRVRPSAGTPLASGNITKSGTSTMSGVTAGVTNFGTLTEVAGTMNRLVVTMPGQSFVAGTGNTGSPTARTAGTPFNIAGVTATDQFFNIVTTYTGAKTLTYSGPGGLTSYTTAVTFAAGQSSTTLATTLRKAETTTLTVGDGITTGPASSSFTVNPGSLAKLQVLLPGESADPGTASGKTGTPAAQTAGTAFNVDVLGVDADWNLTVSTDVVHLTSTDANAALPADAPLVSGSATFSVIMKTAGSRTVSAEDVTNGAISSGTSAAVTVNPGLLSKLQLLVPGETAAPGTFSGKTGSSTTRTAGTAFNVTVNSVDTYWNLVSTPELISLTSSDSYAGLPVNTNLVGGTATLSVTLRTAGSSTLTANDESIPSVTSSTSPSMVVSAGAFTKLQILLPGESTVPGSPTGKTGTPDIQTAGASFNVTVNSVDAQWNPVTSTDVVHLSSSDGAAVLPADASLVTGTKTFSVTLNTAGTQTVTASDVTTPAITQSTSGDITVNPAGAGTLTPASGGESISADNTGGSYVTLVGPVYGENTTGNVGAGAIVLNAPAGFEFDTANPLPTVLVQRTSGSGPDANNINGLASGMTITASATSTQVSVTISSSTQAGVLNSLTWQNVRVRPTAGTPLASGNITKSGTASMTGVNGSSNLGTLAEVAGSVAKLVITLPGEIFSDGTGNSGSPASQTAGVSFTISTITATDQFFNVVPSYSGLKTLAYSGPGGVATYTTSVNFTAGVSNTTLSTTLRKAESTTLSVNDGTVNGPASSTLTVTAAGFSKLQLLVPGETADAGTAAGKTGAPSPVTAGSAIIVTARSVDPFWNSVSSTDNISITSSDVNAVLPANNTLVGGIQTFNVTLRTAGTATITASDVTTPARTPDASPSLTVNAGAFVKLQLLIPGETASPGSATGKTGTPSAQAAGAPFSVIVNAVDASWNPVTSTDVVHFTSTDGAANLPADAPLIGGTRNFSVTLNTTGSQQITVSDVTNGGIVSNTSPSITVANVAITAATGGGAISADNTGGTYTSLTGPLYGEAASGDAGVGTIILNAPAGFQFDTGTPLPTVLITRLSGGGSSARNINGAVSGTSVAVTSVTSTQVTFTITSASNSGVTNSLTWQNLRVRPTAGTPLASGNITKSGTSTMTGVTAGITNFGTFVEVPGAHVNLVITLPGQTFVQGTGNTGTPMNQTTGVSFNITSITATDQFYNVVTSYAGAKTISYSGPAGSPSYTTAVTFTSGQSTTPLATTLTNVETVSISANDGSVSGPASSLLTVIAPTKTWDGGAATSSWGDGANWNPDGVPGTLNDVQLTAAVTIVVDVAANAKDLTLNNSSLILQIQTGSSIAVAGNLSIQSGLLATDESFPSVSGSTSITGGTVGYTSTGGPQTIAAVSYYSLSVSGGTKILGGNSTVAGDVTVASGTLDLGVNSLNRTAPGGSITVASGATLVVGGSTGGVTGSNFPDNFSTRSLAGSIEFSRAGDQVVPALDYGDLTLSNSGVKTTGSGTLTISGALTVSGTATVDAVTNLSSISFTGTAGQTIRSMTYYNLSVPGGVAKSAEGTITVTNNFSNACTFSMGTFTLSVGGTKTNTGIMQFSGETNGMVFPDGTVEYNGMSAQAPGGQTITLGTYGNLLFSNSATKRVTGGTVHTQSGLIIGGTITFVVAADGLLQVDGDLENQGSLTNNGSIEVGN